MKTKIVNFLREYAWVMWLGGSLGIVHINPFNWQWWIITLPVLLLVPRKKHE